MQKIQHISISTQPFQNFVGTGTKQCNFVKSRKEVFPKREDGKKVIIISLKSKTKKLKDATQAEPCVKWEVYWFQKSHEQTCLVITIEIETITY